MVEKQYYSQRKANSSKLRISFENLFEYYDNIHTIFFNKGYLRQVPSGSKDEMNLYSIEVFNKENMLPFIRAKTYSEEDIFDLIEYFYEYLEIPPKLTGQTPRFANPKSPELITIERKRQEKVEPTIQEVQEDYLNKVNRVLSKYGKGYELTKEGYIREIIDNGLEELVDSHQNLVNDNDSNSRIAYAKELFLKHGVTEDNQRSAILELGAVLEKLLYSKKLNLNKKDEDELFNVLNNFNLRHNRKDQKPDYDKEVFYPWIFYNLLAAIDASIKLQRQ